MKKIYIITFMLALSFVAFGQQATNNSSPQFDGEESNEKSKEKINIYLNSQLSADFKKVLSQFPKEEYLSYSHGVVGVVVIQYAIDVDGSVVDTKIFQSAHPLLDAEVLRIFNSMPKWTPAYNRGKPVKTQMVYMVPIHFKKDDE